MGDWGETQPGQVAQTDQRDMAIWCHAHYIEDKKVVERCCLDVWSDHAALPKSLLLMMEPCSLGDG